MKRFSPQLPLTGAIVETGGFADIGKREVGAFAYHRIANRTDKEADNTLAKEGAAAADAVREAAENLIRWVKFYDDPDAVYLSQPRAEFTTDFGDYDLLARRKEWGAQGDGGEDGE
ncbi:MAG: hypothetical protein R3C42_02170 [Parvularculaceae bacterium]